MNIFIVDDSETLCDRIADSLSEIPGVEIAGYADNPEDAVKFIKEQKPDLITLDIRLERGNGIDVLYQAKLEDPSPIIIIFTNYPYPHYRKRCEEEGADYFFNKSGEFDDLLNVVKELAQKSSG